MCLSNEGGTARATPVAVSYLCLSFGLNLQDAYGAVQDEAMSALEIWGDNVGRQPLKIGDYGQVSYQKLANGKTQAMCRVRDEDGVTRKVKATGTNEKRALSALKTKLGDRPGAGSDGITADTNIAVLAGEWLDQLEVSPGTKEIYRHNIVRHIIPNLGGVTIREASPARLGRFVASVQTPEPRTVLIRGKEKEVMVGGPAVAKLCRSVLTGMFSLAVRHGAIRYNPVREVKPVKPKRLAPEKNRALTLDELGRLRRRILEWQDEQHYGPARTQDVIDAVDVWLATGIRSGELLALRWDDIDLTADVPTLEVTGTVRRSRETKSLYRQEYPKSESGERVLQLPQFAVSLLRRRKLAQEPNPLGLVFPSRAGGLIEPNNFNRRWREIRGDEFDWVTPKSFRKAVATMIEEEADAATAAKQLGHSSEDVTRRYYIERSRLAPDVRDILERFGNGA